MTWQQLIEFRWVVQNCNSKLSRQNSFDELFFRCFGHQRSRYRTSLTTGFNPRAHLDVGCWVVGKKKTRSNVVQRFFIENGLSGTFLERMQMGAEANSLKIQNSFSKDAAKGLTSASASASASVGRRKFFTSVRCLPQWPGDELNWCGLDPLAKVKVQGASDRLLRA